MKSISFYILLFLLYLIDSRQVRKPWLCHICEDVVQTWHDQFRCRGEFSEKKHLAPVMDTCEYPQANCDKMVGSLKTACTNLKQQLRTDSTLLNQLVDKMEYFGDEFKTCTDIGKCQPGPCDVIGWKYFI